jgi:hypothetical protein
MDKDAMNRRAFEKMKLKFDPEKSKCLSRGHSPPQPVKYEYVKSQQKPPGRS